MAKKKLKTKQQPLKRKGRLSKGAVEPDSVFLLKLVLYCVLGSLWVRISFDTGEWPLPLGAIIGVLIARHETLQIDRKFEYAVLLMATFLGYWFVPGIYINL